MQWRSNRRKSVRFYIDARRCFWVKNRLINLTKGSASHSAQANRRAHHVDTFRSLRSCNQGNVVDLAVDRDRSRVRENCDFVHYHI